MDVSVADARDIKNTAMFWITDPPYADAVNYHELSEFFLAWDKKLIEKTFPEWYAHSNRAHAVKGTGSSFAHAMIDVYRNLSDHMPDDGMQVVMFTHQDPAVWAELSLILWAAKLQVTAAWNIATETESGGLKTGNYVKGTVLMVLRKNLSTNKGWLDDAYPQIKLEVKNQIDSMRDLDNASDPDFTDNDYMLAAYAASLKVLTSYSELGDVNIEYELSRNRKKGDKSKITEVIESAVRVSHESLGPRGISKNLWRDMTAHEKFYIKALDFERSGDLTVGSQNELAKIYGVSDYSLLQASSKANHARVKTPVEFANKLVGLSHPFSTSLTRHVLMAIYVAVKNEDSNAGRNWLKNELPNYWQVRDKIGELLGFIMSLSSVADTEHWQESVQYAGYVKSLVENDGV
jgi:adenine-specific DNA methylase